ncbi:unnamed protein product, partial [Mesorhabditis belari]|uniref:Transthyretin-like family protein n=1 Tax=Mesorhabditis belari TaxID=2138241 RepID=A0AAF3J817_9BILA
MVTCNGSPYKDAKIKIYELDTLHDDELARTFSNADGKFRLGGSQSELGGISTQLNIYHKCEMPFYKRVLPMCYYKATFPIPTRYVKSGSVSEPYNVQTIELSLHAKGYDCINRRR